MYEPSGVTSLFKCLFNFFIITLQKIGKELYITSKIKMHLHDF